MDNSFRDDIRQIGVVTRYETVKHIRSRRMLVFSGVAALIFVLTTALLFVVGDGPNSDPRLFMADYVGNMFVIIGVSLFFAPAIASEFEDRTALLMFPRPMKKSSLFTGKVFACYIVCGAIIAVYYAVCMLFCILYTGGLDITAFASLGFALLFMMAAGGFALLVSSIVSKSSIAVVITIATLLLVFHLIDNMFFMAHIEPVFSLTYASYDIFNVIQGDVTTIIDLPAFGINIAQYWPAHWLSITVMTVWFLVTTVLAALIFRRREF